MKKLKTNPYGWPDKIPAGNRGNKIQTAKKKDLSKRITQIRKRGILSITLAQRIYCTQGQMKLERHILAHKPIIGTEAREWLLKRINPSILNY